MNFKISEGIIMPDKINMPPIDRVKQTMFIYARQANQIYDSKDKDKVKFVREWGTLHYNLAKKLNILFAHIHPKIKKISFKFAPEKKASQTKSGVAGAEYEPRDFSMIIYLAYDLMISLYMNSDKLFRFFWESLGDKIDHEIIHKEQSIRAKKILPGTNLDKGENAYLSDKREIMTYAHDAAKVFARRLTATKTLKAIRSMNLLMKLADMTNNRTFKRYANMFDISSSVMKMFMKYMYMYLMEYKKQEMQKKESMYEPDEKQDRNKINDNI